jgi:transposase
VCDIVGLYLNPPDKAIVLRVDEKSPMQVRERTQPLLALRPGWPARQTHEEERHGGTPRFAALNVWEGTGIAAGPPRSRHQEFLRFLNRIDESVDSGRPIHLVLDDSGTHQHPTVKKWLAVRPRYPVHFTPTSSSWLNPIERWFAAITRKRIRRGTFGSVGDLTKAIQESLQHSNRNRQPFQWVASARKIIRKVNKYKETSETED